MGAGAAAATYRVGGGSAGGPARGTRPRETARPHLPFWSSGRRFALGSVLVCWVYGVVFAASVLVWNAPEEGGLVSDWYYGTPAEESRLHVHQRWKHRPYSVAYEFACKFTLLPPTPLHVLSATTLNHSSNDACVLPRTVPSWVASYPVSRCLAHPSPPPRRSFVGLRPSLLLRSQTTFAECSYSWERRRLSQVRRPTTRASSGSHGSD